MANLRLHNYLKIVLIDHSHSVFSFETTKTYLRKLLPFLYTISLLKGKIRTILTTRKIHNVKSLLKLQNHTSNEWKQFSTGFLRVEKRWIKPGCIAIQIFNLFDSRRKFHYSDENCIKSNSQNFKMSDTAVNILLLS